MKKNMKSLLMIMLAVMTMSLLPAAGRAVAASVDIPTTTFSIHHLGQVAVVLDEGMPQSIVVRDRVLSGKGIGVTINGMAGLGDVALINNLTLIPETDPLMFEHDGTLKIMVGEDKIVLGLDGKATKTKDLAMLTKTLYTTGDFVIEDATGAFAELKGEVGTFVLTMVCRIVPGEHPMVGSPVEVTFSAMGGM